MKFELQSASNFMVHLIKLGRRNLNEYQLEKFRLALVEVLQRRYRSRFAPPSFPSSRCTTLSW